MIVLFSKTIHKVRKKSTFKWKRRCHYASHKLKQGLDKNTGLYVDSLPLGELVLHVIINITSFAVQCFHVPIIINKKQTNC